MKLNRGVFPGKKTRDRSIERFQDLQLLSFQQNPQKNRLFFSGFQASEPAAPIATGVRHMGGNEVLRSERAMPVTNLGQAIDFDFHTAFRRANKSFWVNTMAVAAE